MKTTTLIGGAAVLAIAGYIAFAFGTSYGPMSGMDHSKMGSATTTVAADASGAT